MDMIRYVFVFGDTNLYLFRLNKNNKPNDIYQFIVNLFPR